MPICFPWTNARQCVGLALWDFMTGLVGLKKGVEVFELIEGLKIGDIPSGSQGLQSEPVVCDLVGFFSRSPERTSPSCSISHDLSLGSFQGEGAKKPTSGGSRNRWANQSKAKCNRK